MIYFHLPNFYGKDYVQLHLNLLNIIENHKDYLIYPDVQIGSIYGCFPSQKWNGGRLVLGEQTQEKSIIGLIDFFESKKIPMRFTYTNSMLTEEDLDDEYCNFITSYAENKGNEILINSPILEQYLRNKYPGYKYILSTTKCILDKNEIIKQSNYYDISVLDFRLNNNYDFLKSLRNPERYEFLLNSCCNPECKVRKEHYDEISLWQLNKPKITNFSEKCFIVASLKEILKYHSTITKKQLYDFFIQNNFQHFKIESRNSSINYLIEIYLYYLIKKSFYQEANKILLSNIY